MFSVEFMKHKGFMKEAVIGGVIVAAGLVVGTIIAARSASEDT